MPQDIFLFSGLKVALTCRCCCSHNYPLLPPKLKVSELSVKKDAGTHLQMHHCLPGQLTSCHKILWQKHGCSRMGTLLPGSRPHPGKPHPAHHPWYPINICITAERQAVRVFFFEFATHRWRRAGKCWTTRENPSGWEPRCLLHKTRT